MAPLFGGSVACGGFKVWRMVTHPADAPSDRRANLALRLAPLLMVAVFGLVGAEVLLFDTAVAIALAAAVRVVYELHAHQRAVDEHQLRLMQDQRVWPEFDADEAVARAPELLVDSQFG